ncbi:Pdx1p SCDLUD_004445 [Saccharomycodes ludwigii]|uniref:Pdx1p n=1 Tax=Saccharomycodes ludwigii TaxID=36035 RepID=UPI001E8308BB|nr:hypothetical protein SCDLUD_004445 [Saccharomycodes ludwigii]KAH3899024.1 hypothetical protein SCDLUD_004445 [Saccharomycodes ludwigii]
MLRKQVFSFKQAKSFFHTTNAVRKAYFYDMPAMSPTMEKGGIVSWKFKQGDSFKAGDVLLDIETDKAEIDVEAQDDGKLVKLILNDGSKNIPVGQPIAILAEPDDDITTLELPKISENSSNKTKKSAKITKKSTKTVGKQAEKSVTKEITKKNDYLPPSPVFHKSDPNQVLYPSVAILLAENNISPQEAFKKIEATGPKGKLLKGDVLTYLGKISPKSLISITEYINKSASLDLSHIELRKKVELPKKPEPIVLKTCIPLKRADIEKGQFTKTLRDYINKFKFLAHQNAWEINNNKSQFYDPLFEALLIPEPYAPRFTVEYKLKPLFADKNNDTQLKNDIFDMLTIGVINNTNNNNKNQENYLLDIEVTVSNKYSDAKEKSERFMDYLKTLKF